MWGMWLRGSPACLWLQVLAQLCGRALGLLQSSSEFSEGEGQALSMLLHSLALLGHADHALLRLAAKTAAEHMTHFAPQVC
jgi:hypothetical protein